MTSQVNFYFSGVYKIINIKVYINSIIRVLLEICEQWPK